MALLPARINAAIWAMMEARRASGLEADPAKCAEIRFGSVAISAFLLQLDRDSPSQHWEPIKGAWRYNGIPVRDDPELRKSQIVIVADGKPFCEIPMLGTVS